LDHIQNKTIAFKHLSRALEHLRKLKKMAKKRGEKWKKTPMAVLMQD
jgi:hypothetical protein